MTSSQLRAAVMLKYLRAQLLSFWTVPLLSNKFKSIFKQAILEIIAQDITQAV
jgi:hypothetical protein